MLIDGASCGAANGRTFTLRHPATGAVICEIPHASAADVDTAITAARRAFDTGGWRTTLPAERARLLLALADAVEREADHFADLEVWQTGTARKLRRDGDIPAVVDHLRYFAGVLRTPDGIAAGEYTGNHTSMIRR